MDEEYKKILLYPEFTNKQLLYYKALRIGYNQPFNCTTLDILYDYIAEHIAEHVRAGKLDNTLSKAEDWELMENLKLHQVKRVLNVKKHLDKCVCDRSTNENNYLYSETLKILAKVCTRCIKDPYIPLKIPDGVLRCHNCFRTYKIATKTPKRCENCVPCYETKYGNLYIYMFLLTFFCKDITDFIGFLTQVRLKFNTSYGCAPKISNIFAARVETTKRRTIEYKKCFKCTAY